MYKYFKQLDKLKELDVFLSLRDFDRKRDLYVNNIEVPLLFLEKYKDIFERINILDMLIESVNEKLIYDKFQSCEQYISLNDFFSEKEEYYHFTKYIKNKINLNVKDLEIMFRDYFIFCHYLGLIYPNLSDFISTTENMLNNALNELNNISTIKLNELSDKITYRFPDAWYITPNGYLYNTGTGHQQGNLIYPFLHIILKLLKENYEIPNINLINMIKDLQERGYVTSGEFKEYANLVYDIITIPTMETEHAYEQFKQMYKSLDEYDCKKDYPHYERTYQRNILTLQMGYYAARTALFQSFVKLNKSKNKKELANTFKEMSLDEVLIRFCGFHKISSVLDKTITTSSINGIGSFEDYLNNGWTLDIIPGIIYDDINDELSDVDFNSYYIDKYIDKSLEKYEGKGKIFIKKN